MATFRLPPSLLLSLATLFWAGNFAFGKVLVATLPPITLSLVRWSLSFLVLLPFAWRDVRDALPLLRQHAKPLLTMAVTGVAGFNALTYVALQSTTAINAA
ncbi:DMT family transporter [Calditerricola satsumensis]|nr:DMT family transporter [Calditerricola satsumensis]